MMRMLMQMRQGQGGGGDQPLMDTAETENF